LEFCVIALQRSQTEKPPEAVLQFEPLIAGQAASMLALTSDDIPAR
jgi:hypothetical protein